MLDVLFINSTEALTVQREVNGTMLLATKLLEAGFQVDILRFCQIDHYQENYRAFLTDAVEKILAKKPQCVSFYTLCVYFHVMLGIARELKKADPGIIVIFGGPQATLTAEVTLQSMDCVDYVCAGEGENTIVPFIQALLREKNPDYSKVPGLYYRKQGTVVQNPLPPMTDLNTLPYWDLRLHGPVSMAELTNDPENQYMPIDAGRGCPFNCTFCCTSTVLNHSYRLKSASRITEDIMHYQQTYGINKFWLSHDALTTNKRLIEELCDCILAAGLNIKWRCTTRIDLITEDLVLKMKRAGLTMIDFGIETGSVRMQKITNKRLDLEKTRQMVSFLMKNKIRVMSYFIYGFPEETREDLNDTLEMVLSMLDDGMPYASIAFCRFFPRTKITQQHYDDLVLEEDMKINFRDMFGSEEELPMIRENKMLFSFFYHLHTPVRDAYPYVHFLVQVYRRFPRTARYLRGLYRGDNVKFYEDLYACNQDFFQSQGAYVNSGASMDPLQMLYRVIDGLDVPFGRQLKALLQFDWDLQILSRSRNDTKRIAEYDFSFLDYQKKRPIEDYCCAKTKLLLQKSGEKTAIQLLSIKAEE